MAAKVKKISIEDFKKKLLKIGYLIPHTEEQVFAQENNLIFSRLSNGSRILGSQKIVKDERYSQLNFNFLSGGYFDKKEREGAHHLLEHLFFSGKLSRFLAKYYINHNAYTSQQRVVVYNNGIYNTKFPKTGLLTGLPKTVEGIIDPPGLKDADRFRYEKNVVLREIDEHLGDHKALTFEKFHEMILAPENPYAGSPLGTRESVESTTQDDIREILEERIGTRDLIISYISSGTGKESASLFQILEKYAKEFPRKAQKPEIDVELYAKTIEISTNTVYKKKLSITNNLVSLFLVWKFDMEAFSEDVVAFNFLIQHLRNVFFNEARDIGLGYTVDIFNFNFMPNVMFLTAYVVVPSNEEKESMEKLQILMRRVVATEKENSAELSELLQIEKATQVASPVSQKSKLETSVSTLADFDLLSDPIVARAAYANVTLNLLQKMLVLIESNEPVKIVIGDVKG